MIASLVPIGSLLTLAGCAGLVWCGVTAARARSAALDDAEMEAQLQKLVAINLASVACAGLGLMVVVIGLFLG